MALTVPTPDLPELVEGSSFSLLPARKEEGVAFDKLRQAGKIEVRL